jgi:predicted 3-demethylubiquinone-9 3-methyltransferase (glyoxalase superfamily)
MKIQKINPCLWFDRNGEEAARFYVSIFRNSKIGIISHYGEGMPGREGSVMTVSFELDGQNFVALNGGPEFKFNEAVSLYVNCETQQELDYYWERLSKGGQIVECGWVKDKFGLAWQIVPARMFEMLQDPQRSPKVMQAVMKMKKLDIATLEAAYNQAEPVASS